MNDRVPSISFINPQACFRYPLLFGKRDQEAENERTIRIFNGEHQQQREQSTALSTQKPSSPLKFTSARTLHYQRPTPYERPDEDKLKKPEEEKPLRVTRIITSAIEINRPFSYMERPVIEKAMKALTEECVCEEGEPVTIKIEEEEENKAEDNKN